MQKDMTAITRQFLTLFNCSMLYGSGHPNTLKNAAAFADVVNEFMDGGGRAMVTVISYNGSLVIEDSPVDKSLNVGKLLSHFDKLGMASVSFERGVSAEGVSRFVELAGDANTSNAERCRAALADVARGAAVIPGVRVNYVQYGRITADEVVVRAADASLGAGAAVDGGAAAISAAGLSGRALGQIEQVLTLTSLLEKPKEVTSALAQTDTSTFSIDDLHGAFGKIRGEIDSTQTHSVGELLESLHNLRTDLYEAIEVQKATGRVMRSAAMIDKELCDLTAHTIVKLVKDEYGAGRMPLNRLAHTIRRMLPNSTELLSVLPRMKEMLLSEGMSLSDYLALVEMLGVKVESESLSDSLKEAADAVGATVSDLVSAIRSKPAEAASLILLASEVRQATGEGDSGLPEALATYVEEVCSKFAVDRCAASPDGGGALQGVLAQLESQMYAQLGQRGVSEAVMSQVRERLSADFGKTLASASAQLGQQQNQPYQQYPQYPQGQQSAPSPSTPQGQPYQQNRPEQPVQQVQQVPQKKASRALKMPPESLNANSMLFLINNEIKRSLRYKSPFATLIVSIESVVTSGAAVRPPTPDDTAELLPQVFKQVGALLRDVDNIGTIAADDPPAPELFILLPMIGDDGAAAVRAKIAAAAKEWVFHCVGQRAAAAVKVSATAYGADAMDLKTYLRAARNNHLAASV